VKDLFIGLDLGTTGCKSAVYDSDMVLHGESYLEYPLMTIAPGWVEQDAECWWSLSLSAIDASLAEVGDRRSVRAIAVSSQGLSIVPTDCNALPIAPAISWLDTRGDSEIEQIFQRYTPDELFHRTGKNLGGAYVLPKLLWLCRHRPELYERTYRFLLPMDYITARLCGRAITDHTMASGTMLYRLSSSMWDEDLARSFGIDVRKMAELGRSGEVVGELLPAVASRLGLSFDTKVVLGGQDQKCASLAAGIADRTVTVSLGTASAIEKLFHTPVLDPAHEIPTFAYLFQGQWVCEGCVMTAGAVLRWFRDNFAMGSDYRVLDLQASTGSSVEDAIYFYPFLSGAATEIPEALKTRATGVFYGLDLGSNPARATRAIMEGVGFQIGSQMERITQSFGGIDCIRLFGGGAKSRFWCQMMADITNLPVEVPTSVETASMGAALLAAKGFGAIDDPRLLAGTLPLKARFEPDPSQTVRYNDKMARYFQIQNHLLAMPE
jgi:xylulokinase